jgi:hypothetical protein
MTPEMKYMQSIGRALRGESKRKVTFVDLATGKPLPDPSPDVLACIHMAERYEIMILSAPKNHPDESNPRLSLLNLLWMCDTIKYRHFDMNEGKINRWIGFVQGCLSTRGVIDVDEERDVFRTVYHGALEAAGMPLPNTLERTP